MIRQIIRIDEEKCNGCGICASACHEGAIEVIDGKARLVHEHFCDGLGDCLPTCPAGAISFEKREAPEYDAQAVREAQNAEETGKRLQAHHHEGSCPGSGLMQFDHSKEIRTSPSAAEPVSRLNQWPVQIKLLPTQAPFFDGADLLIAADCTAYAYAGLHEKFMKGKITLIGCPKLDAVDYTDKLTEIIRDNAVKSVTVVRMEVPCCGGLQAAAQQALQNSGKDIPLQVVIISRNGSIVE